MNRVGATGRDYFCRVPHACGDEPFVDAELANKLGVFPTPVGMNRHTKAAEIQLSSVPHACGDEPI